MVEDWITAAEALSILANIIPREQAINTILDGAYSGQIRARARLYVPNFGAESADCDVSREFWVNRLAQSTFQNWATGDFYDHSQDQGWPSERAIGVRFNRADIAECVMALVVADMKPTEPNLASKGGRPVERSLWDDWIVELVVYVFENGCPEGTKAVSTIRNAIDDSLAKAGKKVPTRNSVNPIIQAVLNRIGPVKN